MVAQQNATNESAIDLTGMWVLVAMSTASGAPFWNIYETRQEAERLITKWVNAKRAAGWLPGSPRYPVFTGVRETNATFFHPNGIDWAFVKLMGPQASAPPEVHGDDDLPI